MIRIQISIVLKVKGVNGRGNEGSVLCEKSINAGGDALMRIKEQ